MRTNFRGRLRGCCQINCHQSSNLQIAARRQFVCRAAVHFTCASHIHLVQPALAVFNYTCPYLSYTKPQEKRQIISGCSYVSPPVDRLCRACATSLSLIATVIWVASRLVTVTISPATLPETTATVGAATSPWSIVPPSATLAVHTFGFGNIIMIA